jgi:HK97 gp10 family phage protein
MPNRYVVQVRGQSGIVANLYNADEFIRDEIVDVTLRYARLTRDVARSLAPVRTGRLRQSLSYARTPGGFSFKVFYDRTAYRGVAYYAPFVEFGTRFMAARPSLLPAFEYVRPMYEADVRSAVIAAISRMRAA